MICVFMIIPYQIIKTYKNIWNLRSCFRFKNPTSHSRTLLAVPGVPSRIPAQPSAVFRSKHWSGETRQNGVNTRHIFGWNLQRSLLHQSKVNKMIITNSIRLIWWRFHILPIKFIHSWILPATEPGRSPVTNLPQEVRCTWPVRLAFFRKIG